MTHDGDGDKFIRSEDGWGEGESKTNKMKIRQPVSETRKIALDAGLVERTSDEDVGVWAQIEATCHRRPG
jgi:hypothetical protein